MHTIDIILPIYKPDEKVYEAIDSVLNQTYTNWHLYIVDDASRNNSLKTIQKRYQANSKRMTYYQFEKNQRAAACRNYAIKKGNGEFISFIDQDDIWVSDKLESQLNYFNNHDVDAIHGNVQFIDNDNNLIMHEKWETENQTRRKVNWVNLTNEELARKILMEPNIRIISSMVKRKIIKKIGGFKEQFFGGEDELFWLEVALHGKIAYLNKCLFYRRIHNTNTAHKFNFERKYGYLKSFKYIKKKYRYLLNNVQRNKEHEIAWNFFKLSVKEKKILCVFYSLLPLVKYPKKTIKKLKKYY